MQHDAGLLVWWVVCVAFASLVGDKVQGKVHYDAFPVWSEVGFSAIIVGSVRGTPPEVGTLHDPRWPSKLEHGPL